MPLAEADQADFMEWETSRKACVCGRTSGLSSMPSSLALRAVYSNTELNGNQLF